MPSQTPVLLDGTWSDAWPLETDPPAGNLYFGSGGYMMGTEMGRVTIRGTAGDPRRQTRITMVTCKLHRQGGRSTLE